MDFSKVSNAAFFVGLLSSGELFKLSHNTSHCQSLTRYNHHADVYAYMYMYKYARANYPSYNCIMCDFLRNLFTEVGVTRKPRLISAKVSTKFFTPKKRHCDRHLLIIVVAPTSRYGRTICFCAQPYVGGSFFFFFRSHENNEISLRMFAFLSAGSIS